MQLRGSAFLLHQVARRATHVRRSAFKRGYATGTSKDDLYDVVCVGGGPAGLSLVAGLLSSPASQGLKIALIEGQDLARNRNFNSSPDSYSNRCSSLTPASVAHLKDIGAWAHVEKSRVQPYQEMEVWDGISDARISFDWAEPYMIENANIIQALLSRLDELSDTSTSNLSLFSSTLVSSVELPKIPTSTVEENTDTSTPDLSSWPTISLSNSQTLRARLLIGADGPNSPVRAFANIQSRGWDYNRMGVVASLKLEPTSALETHTAYQRFLPTGPVALLPLPNNTASLVWSTTPARAKHLRNLSADDLAATVDAAFRLLPADLDYFHSITSGQRSELAWRVPHSSSATRVPQSVVSVQDGSVAAFPLKMRHADTYISERVALVGDAAHTIHPLAGQGLNQGQGDAAALTKTLIHALGTGQDIGSTLALEQYVADRWIMNNALLGVCDKLHKLYSVQSGPLVGLRSLGLRAVDNWSWGKEKLMRAASGQGIGT